MTQKIGHLGMRLALALWLVLGYGQPPQTADAQGAPPVRSNPRAPVAEIAPQRLDVITPAGRGRIPLYLGRDWSKPQPDITRAVLVIHGQLRNADVYHRSALAAQAAAGDAGRTTLMITPQFLSPPDMIAFKLDDSILNWSIGTWMGGEPALAPSQLSSFDALDGILAKLADRALFPALTTVVVAGHSGGGQVVARYAAVGRGEAPLLARGIAVRYVIANPSSYVYFSADRPMPVDRAACPAVNAWKFGFEAPIPYVGAAGSAGIERAFVARDVIYLLGTADNNPNHPALDKSCGAEAQGPFRYARGSAYVDYLRGRHGTALKHRRWDVPGIGHDGDKMLTSACGLAALFDAGTCATEK